MCDSPSLSLVFSFTNEVEFPALANTCLDKFSSDIPRVLRTSTRGGTKMAVDTRPYTRRTGAFCVLVRLAPRCELFRFLVNKRACSTAFPSPPPLALTFSPLPPLFFLRLHEYIRDSTRTRIILSWLNSSDFTREQHDQDNAVAVFAWECIRT